MGNGHNIRKSTKTASKQLFPLRSRGIAFYVLEEEKVASRYNISIWTNYAVSTIFQYSNQLSSSHFNAVANLLDAV